MIASFQLVGYSVSSSSEEELLASGSTSIFSDTLEEESRTDVFFMDGASDVFPPFSYSGGASVGSSDSTEVKEAGVCF